MSEVNQISGVTRSASWGASPERESYAQGAVRGLCRGTSSAARATLLAAFFLVSACGDDERGSGAATGGTGGTEAEGTGGAGGKKVENTGGAGGSGGTETGGTGGMSGGSGGDVNEDFDGQQVFRHDTFGNEVVWTDQLRMHEVIASGVSPVTALSVGLKVDSDALPEGISESADLEDPATTVALLELGAVVGLEATVEDGELKRVGITCALCHSTVDDSVIPGIGKRVDGSANRELNPGAILALSPVFADEEAQAALLSWGPGRYDPRFNQDGISDPVLIPPVYGLDGVPLATYTGDGTISYWNAYVAVTQMGGQGTFVDPRIGIEVIHEPDLVTPKLTALYEYQISLQPPAPPADSFDVDAAARGKELFEGAASCSTCHSGPHLTDAGQRLHTPESLGMDPTTAERSATGLYRTAPLRALWHRAPYFHDGSAATLPDVVDHYDNHLELDLTNEQKDDLVEYLKSL